MTEMKKIPTLFEREYDEKGRIKRTLNVVKPGLEWVLKGGGMATEKVDGAACAVFDGKLYKRYDAKRGKKPPADAIPCIPSPDPITGHWPHWLPVDAAAPGNRWFVRAFLNSPWIDDWDDWTFEAVGVHFQSNPYGLDDDFLEPHGRIKIPDCPRSYEGIREWLRVHEVEGIVWWKDGEPKCKIKRTDFGFPWPVKEYKYV